jgi:SNF2 family DNA or RNA helicase
MPTALDGQVLLADDHLAIYFDYDADAVAAVKRLPGAKWDRLARVWRVPITSLTPVRAFADHWGFWLHPDVATLDLPDHPDANNFGVRYDDDWVWLGFPYDRVWITAVKTIPGITWEPKTHAWKAPMASIDETLHFCHRFNLAVPAGLQTHADATNAAAQHLIDASRATNADLDVAGLPLLGYQRAGVAYAVEAKRTFIADDMGLGKTIQSIATVELADAYPVVVVCPPSLVLNWKAEYHKWLPDRTVAVVTDRKTFPDKSGYDVVVVGWSNIAHWVEQLKGHRTVIADESHYAKSYDAQRTKAAIKIAKTVPDDGLVLALTGTPVTNKPAEYTAQLDLLGRLNDFGGKMGFYRRYCAAYKDKWGHWHFDGHSNLDELNNRLRSTCYIRRIKEQVLVDLPPVRHAPLLITAEAGPMREYKRAEANIVAWLVERAAQIAEELGLSVGHAKVRARMAAESNEHLVRLSVLRKLAAKAKMPMVTEWVEQMVDEGRKVVVAAHHREIVDELAHRFGGLKIQGGMDVADVEEHKSRFQSGDVREAPVIVLSIQAAKTGHTLTAAQDVLFVELPWTPADVDQTYSRCHRLGQTGSVTATYLLAAGTVDEEIYDVVERKRVVVNAAIEGGDAGRLAVATTLVGRYFQMGLESLPV